MSLVHFPSTSRILVDLARQPMTSRAIPELCTVYAPPMICKVSPHHRHRKIYIIFVGLRQSCQCCNLTIKQKPNFLWAWLTILLLQVSYAFLAIHFWSWYIFVFFFVRLVTVLKWGWDDLAGKLDIRSSLQGRQNLIQGTVSLSVCRWSNSF